MDRQVRAVVFLFLAQAQARYALYGAVHQQPARQRHRHAEGGADQLADQADAAQAAQRLLAKDAADVKKVGIQGTPTFFVNGTLLTKFGPEPLLELVQSELQKVR